ncbi:FadR/GntR family transcriptional regulator [Alkalihalobacillus trypoxylicola]|uniref:GntR family transcriptional regulator n=1 Tax=Alkalihalobacillus trypoxylicola TaxID=519424 RepID=A0A162EKU6_9BACI|nr:FadR/GntR family transcriptional regulator [Alkalihalobacillus trypoxylicola]KYG33144.1 GntR family transcriptional regulator [Alkalihalobacillus trypoxylicola]
MSLRPIKAKKIYEMIAEQITDEIKNGQLQAGDRLDSVQQLATKYQVGRSAIREALSALRAVGLIEIRQGEGSFVKKIEHDLAKMILPSVDLLEKKDLKQLFEIRKMIETGAAKIAAEKRTEEDLERFEQVLQEMRQALGDGKLGEIADIQFHQAIVKATKNEMLQSLLETISETMKAAMQEARMTYLYGDQEKLTALYNEHKKIYEAIKERNEEKAFQSMMDHILGVEKSLFIP